METILDMQRRGDTAGIWKRCCGFMDMSIDEFMESQNRLLQDQLSAWQESSLARRLFGGRVPSTVEEFREAAPLTTYSDYAAALIDKSEEGLADKPVEWIHTSGRSGEYEFKWIPYMRRMYEVLSDYSFGAFILGTCTRRGEITLREGDRLMYSLAPLPFGSGLVMQALHEQYNFRFWPPYDEAIRMDFFERIKVGVRRAFSDGIDYFYGISSIMLAISEQIESAGKSSDSSEARKMLRRPKVVARLVKGMIKAKLRGGTVRPRDLWNVKGIMCSGMDTAIYRERIRDLWGRYPREVYGCTEFGIIGVQHYASSGLVFPDRSAYLEFMGVDDYLRWRDDRTFRPRLRVLSEVEAGREYVLVATNFHSGVLVRYILGDALKVTSLQDAEIGLHIPQVSYSSRVDDMIDIAGFTRLTEKSIWAALELSLIEYVDWVIYKEERSAHPVLRLLVEPRNEGLDPALAESRIHGALVRTDPDYGNLEAMAGIRPLEVTLLSRGTFTRYAKERQAAGIDAAHLKPPHMKPKADVVSRLLALSDLRV